jgi:hypothetical protein
MSKGESWSTGEVAALRMQSQMALRRIKGAYDTAITRVVFGVDSDELESQLGSAQSARSAIERELETHQTAPSSKSRAIIARNLNQIGAAETAIKMWLARRQIDR